MTWTLKDLSRTDSVIPFTMEIFPDDRQFWCFGIRDFDSSRVEGIINLSFDFQSLVCFGTGNEVYDNGLIFEGTALSIFCNMAEHTVLDFIPFTCTKWEVTDMNRHVQFFGKLVKLDFPEPYTTSIAAPTIGCDQQLSRFRIEPYPHSLPPPPNRCHCKFSRIMVDPNTYPSLIVSQIVHTEAGSLGVRRHKDKSKRIEAQCYELWTHGEKRKGVEARCPTPSSRGSGLRCQRRCSLR